MVREEKKKKTFGEKARENWHGFSTFLYNKEKGEVMGRNGKSWAKIGLFYVIFYGCLAGFFAAMLAVFLQMLDKPHEGGPKLTQFLDTTPGLTSPTGYDISWKEGDNSSYASFIKTIDAHLAELEAPQYGLKSCPISDSGYSGKVPCRFNRTLLGNCSGSDPTYGFASNAPCFIVAINKVYDFVPNNYGNPYLSLKCSLKAGEADVSVFPEGFLISAFPYRGQSFYRTPPVAVQITMKSKAKARVRCYLSGKGIKASDFYDPSRRFGNVELEASY